MHPVSLNGSLLHPVGGLEHRMPGAWIEPPESLTRTHVTAAPGEQYDSPGSAAASDSPLLSTDLLDLPLKALITFSPTIDPLQVAAWNADSTTSLNLPPPAPSHPPPAPSHLELPEGPQPLETTDSFFIANCPPKSSQPSIENAIHLEPTSVKLSPLSAAMALGDEALSAYNSMLAKSQQLQALFPPPATRPIVDEDAVNPAMDEFDEELVPKNPISGFPRSAMGEYFNAAIDIRNALALRQSIVITDIGNRLGELAAKLSLYDADGAVLAAVDREIGLMQEADKENGLGINFHGLEYFRSKLEPPRSLSFMEKNNLLYLEIQEYLEAHESASNAAYQFLEDPSSLREHRLSPYFSLRN